MKDLTRRYILVRSAILGSMILSAFLIGVKFLVWWHTDSLVIQASLVDSILDLFASSFNMVAVRYSTKPPDNNHQFGYSKTEAIGALIQSLFVLCISVFIIYEAFRYFINPQKIDFSLSNILLIVLSVILVIFLVIYQRWVISKTDSPAVRADEIHYRGDIFHYLFALVVVVSVKYTGYIYLDSIGGLIIGLYIAKVAFKVFLEAIGILIDSKINTKYVKHIQHIINEEKLIPGNLRTRNAGNKFYIYITVSLKQNGAKTESY